ncbi:MAG TPA: hypothetical protein PLV59_01850 [Candidatus Dojkabacteria bacterium]|nr:hypothetical protein [Candidatus Dojkabacteria bacterium]
MVRPNYQLKNVKESAFWADGYKDKSHIVFDGNDEVAKVRDTQISTARSFNVIMRDETVYSFEDLGLHTRAREFAKGARENAWTLATTIQEHWENSKTWFDLLSIEPVTPEEEGAIQTAFKEALKG